MVGSRHRCPLYGRLQCLCLGILIQPRVNRKPHHSALPSAAPVIVSMLQHMFGMVGMVQPGVQVAGTSRACLPGLQAPRSSWFAASAILLLYLQLKELIVDCNTRTVSELQVRKADS